MPKISTAGVESSNIKAIGHDPKTNTLRVEFHSGSAYDYPNVTAEDHQAFAGAESKGRHFHQHFRGLEFVKHPAKKAA